MLNWIVIQTLPSLDNSGSWLARWRWDNLWVKGRNRSDAIHQLKQNSF